MPDKADKPVRARRNRPNPNKRRPGCTGNGRIDWAPAYLAALARSGKKVASAKNARIEYKSVADRRDADPLFAAQELKAIERAVSSWEDEAIRRAVDGVKSVRPSRYGDIVTWEYSDTLMLRLLERNDPRWRQKQELDVTSNGEQMFMTRADRLAAIAKAKADQAAAEARNGETS